MDMEKRINAAAAYVGISQAELARRMGKSPQAFNSKAKLRTFSEDELAQIAAVLGAEYRPRFRFPDGTEI